MLLKALWLIGAFLAESAYSADTVDCNNWHYDETSTSGSDWPTCGSCGTGKRQTPIDIPLSNLARVSDVDHFMPIEIRSPATTPKYSLRNDGHKLTLDIDANPKINVSGAALPATFYVDHVHWHWGNASNAGSEHKLGGQSFAMEGHIVTYDSKYASLSDALNKENGIAVFGILYKEETTTTNNVVYNLLSQQLSSIQAPNTAVVLDYLDLAYFLPTTKYPFYRYSGSLTTPGCSEGLIWTVFANPVVLSKTQMDQFRSLGASGTSGNVSMVNTFRKTQALNDRTVYVVDPQLARSHASATHGLKFVGILALVSLVYYTN